MNTVLARRFIQAAICPFGLLLFVSFAWAQQNSIENFDVTQTGGQVIVRVNLRSPIASAPGSFTIANPARIFPYPSTADRAHGSPLATCLTSPHQDDRLPDRDTSGSTVSGSLKITQ